MKTSEHWTIYGEYTVTVSENARKLAFGAAAICWFFKSNKVTFPPAVFGALISIVCFFIFDLSQYFISAMIRRFWLRSEEKKLYKKTGSIEGEVDQPEWIDIPAFIAYNIKIIALFITFGFLIGEFLYRI